MFGYVTVHKEELKIKEYETYKGFYCGACQALKQEYGLPGQLTLSYDMTFLTLFVRAGTEIFKKTLHSPSTEKTADDRK